jgi:hypothetical protein
VKAINEKNISEMISKQKREISSISWKKHTAISITMMKKSKETNMKLTRNRIFTFLIELLGVV